MLDFMAAHQEFDSKAMVQRDRQHRRVDFLQKPARGGNEALEDLERTLNVCKAVFDRGAFAVLAALAWVVPSRDPTGPIDGYRWS
jgi:hypothetical protein